MTSDDMRTGLPPAFLVALAGQAGPQAPPVRLALRRVQDLPEGTARDDLLLALLEGALHETAPQWLLEQALESGLRDDQDAQRSTAIQVAAAALAHPACAESVRDKALHACTAAQLGALVHRSRSGRLVEAVAAHLGQYEPAPQPMTVDRLKSPGTAELLLATPGLPDAVLAAALNLLPTRPVLDGAAMAGGDGDRPAQVFRAYREALKAWEQMWGAVVTAQVGGARSLLAWAGDGPARSVIRDHLLGTLPWDVEPDLLEEAAAEDLAAFATAETVTRVCRQLAADTPVPEIRSQLRDVLSALPPGGREEAEFYFDDAHERVVQIGARDAVSWAAARTHGTWRYLLDPAQARQWGQPRAWQASEDVLARIGRSFATTTLTALHLWEPDPSRYATSHAHELRWLHMLLVHLPQITDNVRQQASAALPHLRPRPGYSSGASGYEARQQERELDDLHATIRRMLNDTAATHRAAALGSPQEVTVAQLARVDDRTLRDYLERHRGDDLLEKALLSFVYAAHRSHFSFAEVLALHSAPARALVRITAELRSRVGGGPQNRERWTRFALALPDPSEDLIRALPAWTALSTGGSRFDVAHPQVTRLVLFALGDSGEAWARFADSPASYAGPTAWLRLGDILDAAIKGADWPRPPATH
ncbi:hypothetical protein [Streptomyces sp. NPDC056672]|uniref:hypothetical protein n=1 Tax=Streptomyces sp. NPDC056672 TaxID=3345906 RepID=UPI0036ABD4C2